MTTTPQRPIVSSYRQALDAKLSNLRYLGTEHARQVVTAVIGTLLGDDDPYLDQIVDWWRHAGTYAETLAVPYFFSSDVCQLIAAGANALDEDYRLQAEDLPGTAGHFHFASSFLTESPDFTESERFQYTTRMIGVSWITCDIASAHTVGGSIRELCGIAPDKATGILMIVWTVTDEIVNNRQYGLPMAMHSWKFGETVQDVYKNQDAASPKLAALRKEIGHNPEFLECSVLASAMLFMQQTIIQVSDAELTKREQKQLNRDVRDKDTNTKLQIVHLRRRKTTKGTEDDEAHLDEAHFEDRKKIEWSHRWIVNGFWRNQPYPTLGVIKRIWIAPFEKGPQDKPLKVKPIKIAAVVR